MDELTSQEAEPEGSFISAGLHHPDWPQYTEKRQHSQPERRAEVFFFAAYARALSRKQVLQVGRSRPLV